jgi:formylglycine-generating enzyme required for sulfatase activity
MRSHVQVAILALALPTLALTSSGPAHSQDNRAVARALAQEGAQLYEKGDFQAALEKFKQAHKQFASPKLYFNMGQALRGMSRFREALEAFERAETKDASPEYHEQLATQIAELTAKVGRVTVGCNRHGAVVIIDGERRGAIPLERPAIILPGAHQLTLAWEGETKSVEFTAAAGQVQSLVLTFDEKKPMEAAPKPPARAEVVVIPKIQQVILQVPAGSFLMGDDNGEPSERPEHTVQLDAYAIDKYEVTQSQWEAFLATTGRPPPPCHWNPAAMPNHPVVCVSWKDAQTFCHWRGGSLPTEAQWERAARGNAKRAFPWGDEMATCGRAILESGRPGCGAGFAQAVGSRPLGTSPVGALDMAGNVSEWVWDYFLVDYYDSWSAPKRNPRGPDSGTLKVIRGGCWGDNVPTYLHSSVRRRKPPVEQSEHVGFRCAYAAGKR